MIECPEFDYDYRVSHALYLLFLHLAFIASILVNPLIIYCIIYHSTRHMNTYRWFLLLHQIAAFVADLWLNFFAQPVFLVPLPIIYGLGFARHFMSTELIWHLGQSIVVFEQITVILLFFYRYQVVRATRSVSPLWKCFLMVLFIALVVNTYVPLTMEINTEETFNRLAEKYSCITPRLRQIHSIIAVDKDEATLKCFGMIVIDAIGYLAILFFLIIRSWQAARTPSMSPKLRLMQQRFLYQLCLQSLVPLFIVVGPILFLVLAIIFDIFGLSWLNDVVLSSLSLFSIISAITLFIMNPSYHRWVTRRFTGEKNKLHWVSSSFPSSASMIECPEFNYDYETSHLVYQWFLHLASIISLIVNPLIIYCIVFRSPSQMATYRWYLLLHQIAAFVADLWVNFFTQSVVLVPFPAGYVYGYAKHFMSAITIYAWDQCVLVFEQITVFLLFLYRYQAVHNARTLAFRWKCFLAFLVLVQAVNTYLPQTIKVTTEETFRRLAKEYSCITPRLLQIDTIVAFEKMEGLRKSFGLVLIDVVIFVVTMSFLTIGSWKATRTQNMSPALRQMQQKFLVQLCIQSFLPFFVVIVPIALLMVCMIFDIFVYSWLSDVILCSLSLFSIISAVTLFILNPSYHNWLTRHSTRKKAKLPSPSVKTITPL